MKRLKNHNKLMLLGTAATDESGELYLSSLGRNRCDRAAEAFFASGFKHTKGSILITGGYSKEFAGSPPLKREAKLMADYLLRQYGKEQYGDLFGISADALLLEEESTTTRENFLFSYQQFPEFFEDIANYGDRKLGLVSHREHLESAGSIGAGVLNCYERQLTMLSARGAMTIEAVEAQPVATIIPFQPVVEEEYLAGTGDQ